MTTVRTREQASGFATFSFASPYFFTYGNFTAILFSTVVIGTLAIGTTFVIISGGIDLSIGTGMALCAVMSGVFIVKLDLPIAVGLVGTVLFGGLMGLVNGINIAILRIPPFIATLAMMLVAEGLALVLSNSAPTYFSEDPSYTKISTGKAAGVCSPRQMCGHPAPGRRIQADAARAAGVGRGLPRRSPTRTARRAGYGSPGSPAVPIPAAAAWSRRARPPGQFSCWPPGARTHSSLAA